MRFRARVPGTAHVDSLSSDSGEPSAAACARYPTPAWCVSIGRIARDALKCWAIDAPAVLAVFDALGVDTGTPAPLGAAASLRCTDPDDQMFIDLAIAHRAHALLTRDRALLRLASRARRWGVLIATPEAWAVTDQR